MGGSSALVGVVVSIDNGACPVADAGYVNPRTARGGSHTRLARQAKAGKPRMAPGVILADRYRVIPAGAKRRKRRAGTHAGLRLWMRPDAVAWIPASAGMTAQFNSDSAQTRVWAFWAQLRGGAWHAGQFIPVD